MWVWEAVSKAASELVESASQPATATDKEKEEEKATLPWERKGLFRDVKSDVLALSKHRRTFTESLPGQSEFFFFASLCFRVV